MKPKKRTVLIIDDDAAFLNDISFLLSDTYECLTAQNSHDGIQMVLHKNPDLVLLDLMLGEQKNGLDVLRAIHEVDEHLPVIMITDYASVRTAVKAIQLGAYDYITKSPDLSALQLMIERAIRQRTLTFAHAQLKEQDNMAFDDMVASAKVMQPIVQQIKLYAQHKNTVLITGESGVGKEVVARKIHQNSPFADHAFVAVNCAAIPSELMESELFGHEKGAFTGADRRKIGKFEQAGEGIIFLDEISEMQASMQVKLLRALQEREFQRVGGNTTIQNRAKIIAASNQDLQQRVREGLFREDLYYRLDVLPIHVPPLRERKEDIAPLVHFFIKQSCEEMKLPLKSCELEAIEALTAYDWPGNIRQLSNFVTRAVILSPNQSIRLQDLDSSLHKKQTVDDFKVVPTTHEELNALRKEACERASREVEQRFVDYLMDRFDHNVKKASEFAGINRTNLHKMIKRTEEM
jgi:DNA-binding NtrC family response regulator